MKPRLFMLMALLATVACSSTTGAAASPSPSRSPSTSPSSEVTLVPSPSPSSSSADLPLSPVEFSCRLPVMTRTIIGTNVESFQGGFVTFPAQTLVDDPAGLINSTGSPVLTTARSPVLTGNPHGGQPSYDVEEQRWVPVTAAQLSPDGTAYAYGTNTSTIEVVSVADGSSRSVAVKTPRDTASGIIVEAFDGRSAYFSLGSITGRPAGMWRIDVATGSVIPLAQVSNVFAVQGGDAWVGYTDPHDTNPPHLPPGGEGVLFDTLVQVNLTTGARTTWFYRPVAAVTLLALDASGHPVIAVNEGPDFMAPTTIEIRRLNDTFSGGEDNGELVYAGQMSFDQALTDGDRIWLGTDRGIYLYTSSGGLQKVVAFSGAKQSVFPAGFCR